MLSRLEKGETDPDQEATVAGEIATVNAGIFSITQSIIILLIVFVFFAKFQLKLFLKIFRLIILFEQFLQQQQSETESKREQENLEVIVK